MVSTDMASAFQPDGGAASMALPLLPTDVVGSHGIPVWLHVARAAVAQGEFGPTDLEKMSDEEIDAFRATAGAMLPPGLTNDQIRNLMTMKAAD